MTKDRKKYIREYALDVLELTKGFIPEQRKYNNSLDSLETLSNFILELTTDVE